VQEAVAGQGKPVHKAAQETRRGPGQNGRAHAFSGPPGPSQSLRLKLGAASGLRAALGRDRDDSRAWPSKVSRAGDHRSARHAPPVRKPAGGRRSSQRTPRDAPSGIPTPRINRLVLGYLWDISGIGQGYDQVLDIPGVSFEPMQCEY
jgi:hypothetical protein